MAETKDSRAVTAVQKDSGRRGSRLLCVFHSEFREDLAYWVAKRPATATRVLRLVEAVMREPGVGLGKPEKLRSMGPGIWSRRITQEHRLVYRVAGDRVHFLMARYHYR